MSLRICFIAAEVAPWAKTGGLADVGAALSRALDAAGHDIRVFMPLYSHIDRAAHAIEPVEGFESPPPLELGAHHYAWSLFRARLPGSGACVHFVDCPGLYDRATIYTRDPDEPVRFVALTRAALEACRRLGFAPDILHCNDWHTAFGPLLLDTVSRRDPLYAGTRSVLTIHNVGYQGTFSLEAARDISLPESLLEPDDLAAGRINFLRHGILHADAITTVSPTYAREILTPEQGMGLEADLAARGDALVGILNGVDYTEWDPRVDRYLPRHYDADSLHIKAELKAALLERLGLDAAPRAPLLGIVSRLAWQKGFELLFETLPPRLAERDLRFVVLGAGDARYEDFFTGLAERFSRKVAFHRGYSDELAHWIEAAADMFVMPSRYEPCGLNQMYSLRYGTVPIVRRTGGLADSVEHWDGASASGTGIVFNDFDAPAMAWALDTALALYDEPDDWRRLVRNGMARDFSWRRQATLYVDVYRRALTRA